MGSGVSLRVWTPGKRRRTGFRRCATRHRASSARDGSRHERTCDERILTTPHAPPEGGMHTAAGTNARRTLAVSLWTSRLVERGSLVDLRHQTRDGQRESGQANRPISTSPLSALPHVHAWPITSWSSRGLMGRTVFEEGFTLRCFQRLSVPDIATRRCR
jgi:hypothetical protein